MRYSRIFKKSVDLLEKYRVRVYNVSMETIPSDYLKATRRKLHKMAELSGCEYNTSAFIASELERFGYKPKKILTGVICDIGRGSPRLALRADIDALPICENTEFTGCAEFAAEGSVMHACGHDGHAANLLNVARILSNGKSPCPLRLIFQFGEEGIGGSLSMIENGALDGVDEIYALHLCPELEQGKIGYCYGGMFAGCVEFDTVVRGRACHCATPENGADAIKATFDVANGAFDAAKKNGLLLNLGKVTGGAARNIVSDGCTAEYSLRFFDRAKSEAVMMEVERALIASDEKFGTEHDLVVHSVYPPLINHALAVDKVRKIMGDRAVETAPRNTAEDFSNYLLKVPGCMVWLGIKNEKYGMPLHSECFGFDEAALETGTEFFLKLIKFRAEGKI